MSVKTEWEMACPRCGSDEHIDIAATVWVRLTEDGTDADDPADGGHEWDSDSDARCAKCGYSGTVEDFACDPEEAR
jgi:hypothetical protein